MTPATDAGAGLVEPLQVLHEAGAGAGAAPSPPLPVALQRLYGGGLSFPPTRLCANFVSTLDGAVAIPSLVRSNALIADGSEADRFVMGLLRACADVVLIGSGTLHGSPRTVWTPAHAFPPAAAAFHELRRGRGQAATPALAVVTGTGALDAAHPALEAGALVLTTTGGAAALRGRLPSASTVVALGDGTAPDPVAVVAALRERGFGMVLSEAGPHLFGALLGAGLVDELFLTLSPLLAGRSAGGDLLHLVEGTALLPATRARGRLLSARRAQDHLFLRYAIPPRHLPATAGGAAG